MAKRLTPRQIAQVAHRAGFRGEPLVRAVAVALAESGGNPRAVGVNSDRWRSRDRGLWQINDHWHPEVTDAAAFDPDQAAAHAYRISNGGRSWSPWSSWKNGSARAQLGRARIAAAQVKPGSSTGGKAKSTGQAAANATPGAVPADFDLTDPLDPWGFLGDDNATADLLGGITAPLDAYKNMIALAVKSGAWLADSHNWLRVAMVAGGTGGLVLGLAMLAKSGALGDNAAAVAALPAKGLKTAAGAGAIVATGGTGAIAKGAATVGKTATTAAKGTAQAAKTTAKAVT